MKNVLHLFTSHAAPASSDAAGTAASSDPTLIIEAQFSLDSILPLFNFYDNGRAQDLLAILLAKAAELATTAGGALTPDLSVAVAAAQAVTPSVIAPVAPVAPVVAAAPVVVTDPLTGLSTIVPAAPVAPVVAIDPAVTHVIDPSTGQVVPVGTATAGPITHVVDPSTGIIVPVAPLVPVAPVAVVGAPSAIVAPGAAPVAPTIIIAGS